MENSTNKVALKAGSWYIISSFLLKGIVILTTPIFTRLLSPEAFGVTNTYTSWLGIIIIIGTLDIYSCVQIARYDLKDEEMDSFLSSILTVSTISLVILYIVVKISSEFAADFMGLPNALIDVMFLEILFSNAFTILQTKHKAYFKYKEFVAFSAIIAVLSPVFSILLINLQEQDLYYGKIIGNAIPKILLSLFIYIYIMKKGKNYFNIKYWKYALCISIPLIPHHLAGTVLNHFDRIMINKYVGAADTGLYSLAYSYASILSVVWVSFNQAWVPWFFSKMKEGLIKDIKTFVKPYIVIFSVAFIAMLVGGPEAIKVFGPKEYWNSIWVVPPVLMGIFFQFIYSLYVNVEFYMKKTQFIALGTIVAAVINVVLNYILIPKYGYISAAYTTLIGYIIMFVMHYFISNKWEKRDLYDKKFIFIWIILILVITTIITLTYKNILIRYSILIVFASIVTLKYKKNIITIFKNWRKKHG